MTNVEYSKLKAALTRALRSGSPDKIIATVREARLAFDRLGWPDGWPRWKIAVDDLCWHADDRIAAAARAEVMAWA